MKPVSAKREEQDVSSTRPHRSRNGRQVKISQQSKSQVRQKDNSKGNITSVKIDRNRYAYENPLLMFVLLFLFVVVLLILFII